MNLHEDLGVVETGALPTQINNPALSPAVGAQSFSVDNRMYGGQVGFDVRYLGLNGRFSIDSMFKIGGFFDDMRVVAVETLSNGPGGPQIAAFRDDHTTGTFFMDASASATYRFGSHVAVRGGYQVLYLSSLALAPQQHLPSLSNGAGSFGIDSSDRAVYHGPFLSVEFTWGGSY
jgi:hypothetical protein